jgi:hypothetical protein
MKRPEEMTTVELLRETATIAVGAASTEDAQALEWGDTSTGPNIRALAAALRERADRLEAMLESYERNMEADASVPPTISVGYAAVSALNAPTQPTTDTEQGGPTR